MFQGSGYRAYVLLTLLNIHFYTKIIIKPSKALFEKSTGQIAISLLGEATWSPQQQDQVICETTIISLFPEALLFKFSSKSQIHAHQGAFQIFVMEKVIEKHS